MSWLLVLPVALPFAAAIAAFLLRERTAGRWVSILGSAALLVVSGLLMVEVLAHDVVAAQMGGWPAPFGITLVADRLSAVMVLITAVVALAVSVYALADIEERLERLGYHALFQVLIAGVNGAFVTGDLFNLYVWFEVMLIASFGLLVLGGSREQIDGGVKYVALNLIATILFLTGIGLLYGTTGTLNMADLSRAVEDVHPGLLTAIAMLFLIAFGMKAAVFPLFFWLPAAYHTPAFSVSAVFAGLLTKVGVYALLRCFTLIFDHDVGYTHEILLWVAGLTMVTGVLGAAAQTDIRRILSFHIVSQIGYMVLGLALYTPLALVGAVFYLVHHIVVKANLFLVAGAVQRLAGGTELTRIGGLYRSAPLLAALFLVPAFSLAGFPPLSGFWAKFVLVRAALEDGGWVIAAAALLVGLMTIYSMTKIWAAAFWAPHPDGREPALSTLTPLQRRGFLLPIAGLAALTLVIGLAPEPFVTFAEDAAAGLLDPSAYVAAVLGEAPVALSALEGTR
ncbi:Na+/H+ antiporter subunit D [Albimonas sp. CAU 1670]|uniref:Na+/H+ antiporter subunit D n=1 Tax=Albimonas sp. CAU 1670 TaxID=3032599 RepID=UPI0023DA1106|nr:Na+/H+ antiporter subunit D [Albimonas sp. CAU 1670]MDF2230934.1 Na+/H+ antiporter subunit D [Albimonas sp. CAU 1670]